MLKSLGCLGAIRDKIWNRTSNGLDIISNGKRFGYELELTFLNHCILAWLFNKNDFIHQMKENKNQI